MSLRLPQPFPATSISHLQSHQRRLNLIFNTKTHFNSNHYNPTSKTSISISTRRKKKPLTTPKLPPRDLTIPFGKHKGQKLGTLPSKYLKWVAENVTDVMRSEWSLFAEEVLKDPIYKDRIEWDIAYRVLDLQSLDEYRKTAKRFGWDLEDVKGWAMVNKDLIGTSESGRIPRIADRPKRIEAEKEEKRLKQEELKKMKLARVFVGGETRKKRIERRRRVAKKNRIGLEAAKKKKNRVGFGLKPL